MKKKDEWQKKAMETLDTLKVSVVLYLINQVNGNKGKNIAESE